MSPHALRAELIDRDGAGAAAVRVRLSPGATLNLRAESLMAVDAGAVVRWVAHPLRQIFAGAASAWARVSVARAGAAIWLAPASTGQAHVLERHLNDEPLLIPGAAFLGASSSLRVRPVWLGVRGLLLGSRPFWFQVTGEGCLLIQAAGSVFELPVDGATLVSWDRVLALPAAVNLQWTAGRQARLKGRGTVLCQSHGARDFGREVLAATLRRQLRHE